MSSLPPSAWTVHTPRLSLRAYHPTHAAALAEAVERCRPALAQFMPFAQEPATEEGYVQLFTSFQQRFHLRDYLYGIWRRDRDEVVGGCGVHPTVGDLGREAGYWIVEEAWGRGYATEALAALCVVAFHIEQVDRVELRIEPHNHGSRRVAEKAGFAHEARLRRRIAFGRTARDVDVYTLFAADWPTSPGARVPVELRDIADRPLPLPALPELLDSAEPSGLG